MKIGVDIVDLDRIQVENLHFIKRILSPKEQEIFFQMKSVQSKKEFLGGRFAGKEAYLKARQLGIGGIDFHDIEILNHENGAPFINDEAAEISISHEKKYAVAFVVINDFMT
ncbi:holo-ACP synthase [Thomasclavelia spiroformis]|uniref:holo-ACP synthase n=1 Tax=Thomasclavelia spiroformis TaxID=29348 RepID=UPI00241CCE98|nr:holo-ACP synthase [Thomasclavelia spiroformis]